MSGYKIEEAVVSQENYFQEHPLFRMARSNVWDILVCMGYIIVFAILIHLV